MRGNLKLHPYGLNVYVALLLTLFVQRYAIHTGVFAVETKKNRTPRINQCTVFKLDHFSGWQRKMAVWVASLFPMAS